MRLSVEERVPELAGVLSVLALALVFGAVLQLLPVGALPEIEPLLSVIPHLNAVLSAVAVVVIAAGWYWARADEIDRHRWAMLGGFVLFGAFLALYLYRVALLGPHPFEGPQVVAQFVYFPILFVHMVLAVICVPLLFYVLLLGLVHPVRELPETPHPRLGRLTAALWITSFVLGIAVYLMLYHLF